MSPSSLLFHITTASFLPHSQYFLGTYSAILHKSVCEVRWDCLCAAQQLVFNRYHRAGYLILQWEWSSASICSHLQLLHFNYTALIGSACVLRSQRLFPSKQCIGMAYSGHNFLTWSISDGKKNYDSFWKNITDTSVIISDNAHNAFPCHSVRDTELCSKR